MHGAALACLVVLASLAALGAPCAGRRAGQEAAAAERAASEGAPPRQRSVDLWIATGATRRSVADAPEALHAPWAQPAVDTTVDSTVDPSFELGRLVVDVLDELGRPAGQAVQLSARRRGSRATGAISLTPGHTVEVAAGAYVVELVRPLPRGYVLATGTGRDAWSAVDGPRFEARVRVEPQRVAHLDLTVHRSARVAVQVEDPSGVAASQVVVRLAADDGTGPPSGAVPVVATVPVDEAGRVCFDVAASRTGSTYIVRAFPAVPDALASCSPTRSRCGWTSAARIGVRPGEVRAVTLRILAGERSLAGRVVDELGDGCAGLRVVAFGEHRAARGGAVTDASGAFRIDGVDAGPLTLRVEEAGNPHGDRDGGLLHGWVPSRSIAAGADELDLVLDVLRRKPARVAGRVVGSARAIVLRGEASLELLLREHRPTRTGRADQALPVAVDDDGCFAVDFEWGRSLPAELRLRRRDGAVVTGAPVDLRHGVESHEVLLR